MTNREFLDLLGVTPGPGTSGLDLPVRAVSTNTVFADHIPATAAIVFLFNDDARRAHFVAGRTPASVRQVALACGLPLSLD